MIERADPASSPCTVDQTSGAKGTRSADMPVHHVGGSLEAVAVPLGNRRSVQRARRWAQVLRHASSDTQPGRYSRCYSSCHGYDIDAA